MTWRLLSTFPTLADASQARDDARREMQTRVALPPLELLRELAKPEPEGERVWDDATRIQVRPHTVTEPLARPSSMRGTEFVSQREILHLAAAFAAVAAVPFRRAAASLSLARQSRPRAISRRSREGPASTPRRRRRGLSRWVLPAVEFLLVALVGVILGVSAWYFLAGAAS
jgi:hypothetical protein